MSIIHTICTLGNFTTKVEDIINLKSIIHLNKIQLNRIIERKKTFDGREGSLKLF